MGSKVTSLDGWWEWEDRRGMKLGKLLTGLLPTIVP